LSQASSLSKRRAAPKLHIPCTDYAHFLMTEFTEGITTPSRDNMLQGLQGITWKVSDGYYHSPVHWDYKVEFSSSYGLFFLSLG